MRGDLFAGAIVEALAADPSAVARLRALLAADQHERTCSEPPAYTVDSLAAMLSVTPKVVRNAIAQGDLCAVKRGGRWIIPSDAVRNWATPSAQARLWVRRPAAGSGRLAVALARLNDERGSFTMPEP